LVGLARLDPPYRLSVRHSRTDPTAAGFFKVRAKLLSKVRGHYLATQSRRKIFLAVGIMSG
jgi:hypothetical protein